jgi:hypothetical protein
MEISDCPFAVRKYKIRFLLISMLFWKILPKRKYFIKLLKAVNVA